MIYYYIMKTATVADLRNNFRRVSAWIANGEEVEIRRRGKPFAKLSALVAKPTALRPKIDFAAQRRAIWGRRQFSAKEVAAMRAAELEGEEG
jgi:antitoxin (DNA-binding transcriptional repressor) of toxin-antitoxin stability system